MAVMSTCSADRCEFCRKNLVRFFITPKLKSYQTKSIQMSWSCGYSEVHPYHIFWNCLKIETFWKNIWKNIKELLRLQIPRTCIALYLGDMSENIIGNDRYLFKLFTVAAKEAITRKWLQADPPTVDDWLNIIKDIHEMERLTFVLRLQSDISTSK